MFQNSDFYVCYGLWLGRRTCDQAIVGLNLTVQAIIKLPRSTQPSIPLGYVNRVLAWLARVKLGHIHLCWVAGSCMISYGKHGVRSQTFNLAFSTHSCFQSWFLPLRDKLLPLFLIYFQMPR